MLRENQALPENLQGLIKELNYTTAIPLGEINEAPFIAIKIPDANENTLKEAAITCEFRPLIFNIEYEEYVVALCAVQFRLNNSDDFIYTTFYNLQDDKQFKDCFDLLAMQKYGLLVATNSYHDFLLFDAKFEADFSPRAIAKGAREKATEYPTEIYATMVHAIRSQAKNDKELYAALDMLAPYDKMYYASMKMHAQKDDETL